MHQRCSHGGIHSAAQRADGAGAFGLLADGVHGGGDEAGAIPVFLRAADGEYEILQDFRAAIGVIYFGMKLHAIEFLLGILDGGDGVISASGDGEACGNFDHMVAVTVPDLQVIGNAGE